MAITNAQQFKQLVNPPMEGKKRPGYRGEAAAASDKTAGRNAGRSDTGSKSGRGDGPSSADRREQVSVARTQGRSVPTTSQIRDTIDRGPDRRAVSQFSQYGRNLMNRNLRGPTVRERISRGLTNLRNRNIKKFIDRSIRKDLFRSGFVPNSFMGINLPTTLGIASETAYSLFGPEVDSFDEDSLREIASTLTTTGGSLTKSQSKALESFAKNIANRDELLEKGMTQERFEELYPKPVIDDRDGPQPLDPCKGPNPPAYCFIGEKAEETIEAQRNLAGLTPRIGGSMFDFTNMADGGLAAMDREAFLLGGIAKGLKKATRAVKKIAKSPIGKAALGIAAFKFGPTIFGKGSFNPFLRTVAGDTAFSPLGSILSKAGLVSKSGLPTFMGGITFASILPLLAGKTDDEKKDILNDYFASQELTPSTTKRQAGSEFDFYNYNLAEGGTPRKEPVAKKVMPLLDMGGMEKDYRAEGGFVPIGRMEKADDVPARLSKNEFVFTADAVRNAGEGDVDKGAEVMYNMMKNLEAGGEVSEESQGLDGARKMFQTSQRLGEVI